jgi:hypothetical protein
LVLLRDKKVVGVFIFVPLCLGAGQSTNLIVGLGTYVGGELVVEKRDKGYYSLQGSKKFNGLDGRHWTAPLRRALPGGVVHPKRAT